jgi:hypothetical protein
MDLVDRCVHPNGDAARGDFDHGRCGLLSLNANLWLWHRDAFAPRFTPAKEL